MFKVLKIRMIIDIFGTEKCKVTFGLKYVIRKQYETPKTCEYMQNKDSDQT